MNNKIINYIFKYIDYAPFPFFLMMCHIIIMIITVTDQDWFCDFSSRVAVAIICMIPVFVYFMVLVIATKKKWKNSIIIGTTFTCMILLIFPTWLAQWTKMFSSISDIENYSRVYEEQAYWVGNTFPKEIPAEAEKVEYIYIPGMFQGGSIFELYCKMQRSDLDKYTEYYKTNAVRQGSYGEIIKEYSSLIFRRYENYIGEYEREDFFENVYVFFMEMPPDDFNHGEYAVVAVNEKYNLLMYIGYNW